MASGSQNMTTFKAKGLTSIANIVDTSNFIFLKSTTLTADQLGDTVSLSLNAVEVTGAAMTNHSLFLNAGVGSGLGTPFQLQIPDSSHLYIYKRWYSSNAWSGWSKISAGHADDAAKWTTARTITLTGSVTGSVSIDGSDNVSLATTTNHNHDWRYPQNHITSFAFTGNNRPLSRYVTFDVSAPAGGPGGWINGFMSVHNDYLASYIVQVHRSDDWYLGWNQYSPTNSTVDTAPVWRKILHSGNYNDYAPTKTGGGASGTWGISISGTAAYATAVYGRISIAKGTNPSAQIWPAPSWFVYEKGSGTAVANRVAGGIESYIDTNGVASLCLRAYQHISGSTNSNSMEIKIAKDGTQTYTVSNAANFRSAIGVGASGTHADSYFALASHSHNYVSKTGDTMTGSLTTQISSINASATNNGVSSTQYPTSFNICDTAGRTMCRNEAVIMTDGEIRGYWYVRNYNTSGGQLFQTGILLRGFKNGTYRAESQLPFYNAVWNDYAEFRKTDVREGGRAIGPSGNLTTQRLEAGVRIVSDTFGHAIGYMEDDDTLGPVAISGRVLAYPYRNQNEYKIGDAVCSAPGGTVDIMTRDEIKEYPDRIIGIVNEIPDYDIWEPSREGRGGA